MTKAEQVREACAHIVDETEVGNRAARENVLLQTAAQKIRALDLSQFEPKESVAAAGGNPEQADLNPVVRGRTRDSDEPDRVVEPEPPEDVQIRCLVTGNLCGTDTRPEGKPCQCETCRAANLIESLSAQLSGAKEQVCIEQDLNVQWQQRAGQAEQDAMTMTMRLMGEDEDSFGPECYEVMKRWKPKALELLRDAAKKGGEGE